MLDVIIAWILQPTCVHLSKDGVDTQNKVIGLDKRVQLQAPGLAPLWIIQKEAHLVSWTFTTQVKFLKTSLNHGDDEWTAE